MEQEIKNKIAVITGGSQGTGFAIAEQFLKEGAKTIIIVSRNYRKGNEAVRTFNSRYGKGKTVFVKADVTKDLDKTFQFIVDTFKTIDILVNNAGISDERDIKRMFEVNTIAPIEWSIKFLDHMRVDKGGKGGTILNISSVNAFKINPFKPIYRASKFAINGFSQTYGHVKNFEVTGVKVVVLCPGFTITSMSTNSNIGRSLLTEEDYQEYRKTVTQRQKPSDVAAAAVHVIKTVDSGSAWFVGGAKPMRQILESKLSKI